MTDRPPDGSRWPELAARCVPPEVVAALRREWLADLEDARRAERLDSAIGAASEVLARLCRALGIRLPPGAVDAIAAEVAEAVVDAWSEGRA